jgi:hypothetical protein
MDDIQSISAALKARQAAKQAKPSQNAKSARTTQEVTEPICELSQKEYFTTLPGEIIGEIFSWATPEAIVALLQVGSRSKLSAHCPRNLTHSHFHRHAKR